MNKRSNFTPLYIALGVIAGLLIGSFCSNHFGGSRLSIINSSSNKVSDLLHIIEDQYVDKVEINALVEKAMPQILKELDPHSTYVTAKNVELDMQSIKGSFCGIGVIFTIFEDTARIIRVIPGGPSEGIGLQAGDRIVEVDGKNFVSDSLTNDYAMSKLKGKKDSEVKVGVMRPGEKGIKTYTITRSDVPVKSIPAVYMLDNEIGYIQITKWSDTTYPEMLVALAKLNHLGFKKLVIDLRGNGGGLMAPAIRVANEFLPADQLIVYTEGRRSPRSEYKSDGRGTYQKMPLIVMVDETSASASEIFTAAIQDNDRGTIIGRRTFGKGLVQEPIQFNDGSMLRLTIARYYSASGRCLQKPYVQGNDDDYQMDLVNRAKQGEYLSKDSIHLKGKEYKTRLGRSVYSEGGVMPDFFIPEDTIGVTSYYMQALTSGLANRFAFIYLDQHRKEMNKVDDWKKNVEKLKKADLPGKFAKYAAKNGIKERPLLLRKSYSLLQNLLIQLILDNHYGDEIRQTFSNTTDETVAKALEIFKEGNAFPEKPNIQKPEPKKKG